MESEEIKITEDDVIELMDNFTKVPSFILKGLVSGKVNVVKSFQNQIESDKDKLSAQDMSKIRVVLETPVPELQNILHRAYLETNKKQLKILADPGAEPFIEKNLRELEVLLFKNEG